MYYMFGNDSVQRLLRERCGVHSVVPLSDERFRTKYNRYLEQASILSVPIDWTGLRFVDFPQLFEYAPEFCMRKSGHYAGNSDLLCARIKDGFFESATSDMARKAPEIVELATFCVRIVIVNQLSHYTNGTTEDTLGVANFDFRDHYDELDFQELLFHQLTHMLLFLDDSLRPHMDAYSKETMIPVGLPFVFGGTDFPAYLAFHSYIVAVEMLLYREATGQLDVVPAYHRSTGRVTRAAEKLRVSLVEARSLFGTRGTEILDSADSAFAAFSARTAVSALA